MAMAATITESSRLSYAQMNIKRSAGTVTANIGTFITAVGVLFPDENPNNRPIGNWLVPLAAVHALMNATPPPTQIDAFNQAVDIVAKISWATLSAQGGSRITAGQAVSYLAAWNTAFGT